MRWKLIALASLVAAAVGFGLWCAITLGFFAKATNLARHDWLFLASFLLPLGMAVLAAVFVYRHTARRRRLQAVITGVLSLVLTAVGYFAAVVTAHDRFIIPRTHDERHAR